jgi:hypothetical protein
MSTSISSGRAHLTFQYSPLVGWIARDARVAKAPSMQSNSLVASGSRITSIALSTVQALRAIVAAQSSATTETICLSFHHTPIKGQASVTGRYFGPTSPAPRFVSIICGTGPIKLIKTTNEAERYSAMGVRRRRRAGDEAAGGGGGDAVRQQAPWE